MIKDEALKLALEALENHEGNYKLGNAGCDRLVAAITAIKEALSQPEQEPVAQWQKRHHLWTEGAWENSEEHDAKQWRDKAQGLEIRALYTTPQQRPWVGLTDEEMDNFVKAAWGQGVTAADFIRAIEAKLKEKNFG